MNHPRAIRVSCPECEVVYRLPDPSLLPIARCGRCYGSVQAETAHDEAVAVAAAQHVAQAA